MRYTTIVSTVAVVFTVLALPMRTPLAMAADTPPANIRELLAIEARLNEQCRGGSGDSAATLRACAKRDQYFSKLESLGWCWGPGDQPEYKKTWMRCGGTSSRRDAAVAGCATVTADPKPPVNVRGTPSGRVVTTLRNGVELTIADDRSGWLRISAPVVGWVHVSVTQVTCGTTVDARMFARIRALGTRARVDPLDADTLVRFAVLADGAPGESASGALADLMLTAPRNLIGALDQLTETQRRQLLRDTVSLNADQPDAIRAFDRAVSEEPSRPTATTWNGMRLWALSLH